MFNYKAQIREITFELKQTKNVLKELTKEIKEITKILSKKE